jgi:lysophospholipase L1-like esterase
VIAARAVLAVLAVVAAWAVATVGQQPDNPATKAVPRKDAKGWMARHESFVAKAKAGGVDVLFLGDSITQGWENNGKEAWAKTFAPLKAANFGIGGDRTQHVLWRITEGKELEGIDPKVAVIMIGTNNISTDTAEQIADGVAAILAELRKQRPKVKVLLLGVFPRSGKPAKDLKDTSMVSAAELHPKVKQINQRLAKMDDGKNVKYLDIGDKFLDKDGGLSKAIMNDYLHLTPKGYQIWADAIKKPVEDLLKD